MDTTRSGLRALVVSSFRLTVVVLALLLLSWIVVGGFLAILTQPYVLAAFWLMGMVGLLLCVSAYLNTFPGLEEDRDVPHPLRAISCLGVAAALGWILWTQAEPAMANEPLGLSVAAAALAGTVLLSCVLVFLFSLLILLGDPKVKRASKCSAPACQGMVDFSGQEKVA
jgi:hypothetical protein